ncbi:MAG: tRNA (N(6)-L-threonylcarbamoyladenosine(37)-C(2))-methylthiotransferase MtaB [Lachnospiraceae bacterium]|nr:tRNA (N(6)-L-threonylcarbamoyladenosine(37)-C(2))-methylthiotransferase MtaB [Lachnospiraceae bacterium]
MKIAFLTLGCKVNSYETERMKSRFEDAGYRIVAFSEQADIYLVNTCTVTNIADRKSRKMLHRARRMNPDAVVVAAGCYVDSAKQKGEVDEAIDLFLSNTEKDRVVELVETALQHKLGRFGLEKDATGISAAAQAEEHTRAYIQVQNGCNQYCSYCIIPYVRGPLTSKPVEQVKEEVRQLAEQRIQEIVVTGIHLSSYGVEGNDARAFVKAQGIPLLELLEAIEEVEGIRRIRLGSLEPRIITQEFVKRLAKNEKICPHFHLSLQSGCDTVLKRMNRHYSTAEYQEKVEILRKIYEHPAITTDIIVGFPQETEEEFQQTRVYAEQIGFAQIHVFKYSRRQGTVADRMEGQVSEQEKAVRSDMLIGTQSKLMQRYQEYYLETTQDVLFEEITEIDGRSYLTGYTTSYVRVAVAVIDMLEAERACNTIVSVRIMGRLDAGILCGEIAS